MSRAEMDLCLIGDSINLFLEYESDSEKHRECYPTIDGTAYTILTRIQKGKTMVPNSPSRTHDPSTLGTKYVSQGMEILQSGKEQGPFDFVKFYKDSKTQISPIDYLETNPAELKRFIDHCKGDNINHNHNVASTLEDEFLTSNIFEQEEPTILATFPSQKPEPFYVSLYINGYKLNNYIIDSGASNNVITYPIAKSLGLTITKVHGRCYSMDTKQVPFLGQIKDAQVALAIHPKKKLLLTILVVDIRASYGLFLSRIFCRDLGREIKLDWS